jgi:hypothetical protein
MSFSNVILLLSNVPILLVAIYAAIIYARIPKEMKIFSWYTFVAILIQIPAVILYLDSNNNQPLLHIYTLLGGVILILFYREVLRNYLNPNILNVVALVYGVFCVINSLFFESIYIYNTNALLVETLILIILSISIFSLHLQEKAAEMQRPLRKSINWINSGIFIYFSSSLLLNYSSAYLEEISIDYVLFRNVWILHALFIVTQFIFFFIGLWKIPKQ